MQAVGRYLLLFLVGLPALFLSAQTSTKDGIFTISVAPPTSPKDVQVRYFITDDSGGRWASTAAANKEEKIVIRSDSNLATAKGFRAIAYAPGCQFVTFAADDLSTSPRQGEFACQKLPMTELHGSVPLPSGNEYQVEAMYVVNWAGKFFRQRAIAISPITLGSAKVESDGTFSVPVPDFTADPEWNRLTKNASLMLFLVDKTAGQRVAGLKAPASVRSRDGNLKVAASYPDITFAVEPSHTTRASKLP